MTAPPWLSRADVILRPLTLDDAPALHIAHRDADVHRYWSSPAHASEEETRAYTADTIVLGPSWAITQSGGEALGRISLFHVRAGVAEIGIILRRAAQGRGLSATALALVSAHAFANGYHRLVADIDPDNAASLRLFEKAGFVREGVLRQNWITHLGVRDSILMALLKSQTEETP
ncbi:MAG: GNAT family N-acetyltransferase [Alphaproteobacteria bacterium]|nr:GNAT family N-acetyltransferase [Alphaproteobacteria bacterium]